MVDGGEEEEVVGSASVMVRRVEKRGRVFRLYWEGKCRGGQVKVEKDNCGRGAAWYCCCCGCCDVNDDGGGLLLKAERGCRKAEKRLWLWKWSILLLAELGCAAAFPPSAASAFLLLHQEEDDDGGNKPADWQVGRTTTSSRPTIKGICCGRGRPLPLPPLRLPAAAMPAASVRAW